MNIQTYSRAYMVARKVTPKAVDLMLAQLGGALPRELTGRTRYRAWGIV